MPLVMVQLLSGRSQEQKDEMAAQIVETISTVGRCPEDSIHVVFHEVERGDWFVGRRNQLPERD